jgi:hypothetical protein
MEELLDSGAPHLPELCYLQPTLVQMAGKAPFSSTLQSTAYMFRTRVKLAS